MNPLRIAILAKAGTAFDDWETRLIAGINDHSDLKLVGVFAVESDAQVARNRALNWLMSIERKTLMRLRRPPGPQPPEPPRIEPLSPDQNFPEADIYLSHCRGGWSKSHTPEAGELWGYDILLGGDGRTAGMAEVASRAPTTTCALIRKVGDGADVLDLSITNTKLFGALNNAYLKDKLVPIVLRALGRRQRNVLTPAKEEPPVVPHAGPGPVQYAVALISGLVGQTLSKLGGKLGARNDEWSLLSGQGDILQPDLKSLTELSQPASEFRADPFLFDHDGDTLVFFEALPYASGRGRIKVGRLAGNQLADEVELDLGDIHLSYPFVFEQDGQIFMIPETHQRDRVEVWRATRFPSEWALHATALDGCSPADTALVAHGGDFWLFTNLKSGAFADHGQELHIFRTDGPDLTWLEPHADNPVVIDTTSARNGGRPFHQDGALFRPAQIFSHGNYGHGLKIMRVTDLTPSTYREEEVLSITPEPGSGTTGCHHLDVLGDRFIIDARRAFGSPKWGAKPIRLRVSRPAD